MLDMICIPCQYGSHEKCSGGRAPPPGMLGGSRCVCKHEEKPKPGSLESISHLELAEAQERLTRLLWTAQSPE